MADIVPSAEPLPRRRWFRYSLRAALILTTLVAVILGLGFRRVERQRLAVESVEAAGGSVTYDWEVRPNGASRNDFPRPPGPMWLRVWLGPQWFDDVVGLKFYGERNGPQRQLSKLQADDLPAVRQVTFDARDIGGEEGRQLARYKGLVELRANRLTITPEGARELARASGLKKMDLREVIISPQAIAEFAALPELEDFRLECRGADQSKDNFRAIFNGSHDNMTREELLASDGPQRDWLTDDGLRALAHCKQLRSLVLYRTMLTDEGMTSLRDLNRLETIAIQSEYITGKSLETVATLPKLHSLDVVRWQVAAGDLAALKAMPQLRTLSIYTGLRDDSVPMLARLTQIKVLRIRNDNITYQGRAPFRRFTHLVELDLGGSPIP